MQAELAANENFQDYEGSDLDPLKAQKISLAIFAKKIPYFIVFFIVLFALLESFFWQQVLSKPDRFVAYTSLVYNPQEIKQYSSLDAKLVVELFTRSNIRRAVAAKLGMSPGQESALEKLIEVLPVQNKSNFFLISTKGKTAEKALELNRAVVSLVVTEFQKFRIGDLTERLDYLQKQKEVGLKEVAEYEMEMQKLLDPVSLSTPEQQINTLREMISRQVYVLIELKVKIANLQMDLADINEKLKDIDPNTQDYLDTISYYSAEQERLNRDLLKARQLFTDQNPKVKANMAELQLISEQKEAFIKEKNLSSLDPEIPYTLRQLKENKLLFTKELGLLSQQYQIAEQELKQNNKQSENLLVAIAEENKLNNKINSVKNAMKKADLDIPLLKTLLASVPQELIVLEPASSAESTQSNLLKKTIIALFLAGLFVFNMALLWVGASFFWGKIEFMNEISLLTNIDCLGGFPNSETSSLDEDHLLEISHDLFFKLKDYLGDGKILFEAGFVGTVSQEKIRALMNINFAMNGMRHFNLICDSYANLQKDPNASTIESNPGKWEEELLAVEKKNPGLGFFSINNPNLLLNSEIEILTRDVNLLKKHYDLIVISRKTALNGQELIFQQLTDFSDCCLLLFGFKTTPRSVLRLLGKIKNDLASQLCCIFTGVKKNDWK
ncbi:MAG: hypothetical protein WCT05_06500 [Lentisphaeria bacterium]